MKVTQLSFMPIRQGVKEGSLSFQFGELSALNSLILRVTSQDGEHGFGVVEATPPLGMPSAAIRHLLELFSGAIIGENADDHKGIMQRARRKLLHMNYSVAPVFAALDCALHDLAARLQNIPLFEYLGGTNSTEVSTVEVVPGGAHLGREEFFKTLRTQGINAVKLKLTGNVIRDIDHVCFVRKTIGEGVKIICDANGAYSFENAKKVASSLETQGVSVFEQPIDGGDLPGMAALTAALPMDVEADESVCSAKDVKEVARLAAANCISIRISRFGGIEQTMDVAKYCSEAGLSFRFGAMFAPSIASAISTHVILALTPQDHPHELTMHRQFTDDPFEGFHVNGSFAVIDPDSPGIGLQLRNEFNNFTSVGS